MRGRLVAGNWKMHGSLALNQRLLDALKTALKPANGVAYAICAPYPYLHQVSTALTGSPVAWGAQNLSEHDAGAYTGEVSGAMLREFGCRFVIVGHSERRGLYGEDDKCVAAKFMAAQRAGLTPILCVGGDIEQRERGDTEAVVARQLEAVLAAAGVAALATATVAYEPVWAIGTGKNATPEQAQGVHAFVRGLVARRDKGLAQSLAILYGGSVKSGNAAQLFAMPDVDGGLIGGASLVADDFIAICEAARNAVSKRRAKRPQSPLEGTGMDFWFTLILIVDVVVALGVIGLVLLQHGKGADVGAAFGSGASGSLFGATGSANFLSRSTAVLAVIFFLTTFALAYFATHKPRTAGGVMDTVQEQPAVPVPRRPGARGGARGTEGGRWRQLESKRGAEVVKSSSLRRRARMRGTGSSPNMPTW